MNANSDLYFGQLLTIEDYSVYGCYTNCHNKIIVVANHTSTEISAMKDFIYSLCAVFTAAIQNPFHSCGQPLDQVGTMKNKVRCLIESHSASAKKLTY